MRFSHFDNLFFHEFFEDNLSAAGGGPMNELGVVHRLTSYPAKPLNFSDIHRLKINLHERRQKSHILHGEGQQDHTSGKADIKKH
ncbi:MAG: hypothetical protein ACI94C_001409, partial [Sediminicola sp.]